MNGDSFRDFRNKQFSSPEVHDIHESSQNSLWKHTWNEMTRVYWFPTEIPRCEYVFWMMIHLKCWMLLIIFDMLFRVLRNVEVLRRILWNFEILRRILQSLNFAKNFVFFQKSGELRNILWNSVYFWNWLVELTVIIHRKKQRIH